MIAEHTAIHTPTHRVTNRTFGIRKSAAVGDSVECPIIESKGSRSRRIVSLTVVLWGALAASGNPSFFEFERRIPEHRRLGPGLSRASDSFWPIVEW